MLRLIRNVFAIIIINTALLAQINIIDLGEIYLNTKKINDKTKINKSIDDELLKSEITKILGSLNIKYNYKIGLIETSYYKYKNKASKLFIRLIPDENYISLSMQQTNDTKSTKSNFDPYLIKKRLNEIFK